MKNRVVKATNLKTRAIAGLAISIFLSSGFSLHAQASESARLNGFLTPINDRLSDKIADTSNELQKEVEEDQESEDVSEAGHVYSLRASKSQGENWSLPIYGPLTKATELIRTAKRVILKDDVPQLDVGISLSDQSKISHRIDDLLDSALTRDDKTEGLNKAVHHYNKTSQKVIAEVKDGFDYLIPYRGFGPSAEAGNVILGEKVKVHSRASAEYARQRLIDEKHLQVVSSMSQIAMGMGMSDKSRGSQIVQSGKNSLSALVGEEEADKTISMLNSWRQDLQIPDSVYAQGPWDVESRQNKLQTVLETSLEKDVVVNEIKRRLHKYNQKSKFAMVTSQVVQTTLGVAAMTPTFIGPAAKVALLSFVMATGGPESCKLMKELYLDKRFESRYKVTSEEAHLAVENYHIAVLTHNPTLLAFSESMIAEMAGRQTVTKVLGTEVLAYATEMPADFSTETKAVPELSGKRLSKSSAVVTQ